jgi:ferrous iron transport protein A
MIATRISRLQARFLAPRHHETAQCESEMSESSQLRSKHHERPNPFSANQSSMPLALVTPGDAVVIQAIHGGHKMRQRLLDLGLNQGARVRVLKNDIPGPLIIAVKEDGRLALGRGMTQKIFVVPFNDGPQVGAQQNDS